jgi:hypothetical protein
VAQTTQNIHLLPIRHFRAEEWISCKVSVLVAPHLDHRPLGRPPTGELPTMTSSFVVSASFVAAVLFGFTFYNSRRHIFHFVLAFSYVVPLCILTCWLILAAKRLSLGGRWFWFCDLRHRKHTLSCG